MSALFDLAPLPRWTGSRALVPLPPDACPACGGPVQTITMGEAPLFCHAGYGAVRQSVTRACVAALAREGSCRWALTVDVTEVNPRERRG